MQFLIYLDRIGFYHRLSGSIVTFGSDPLDFRQQFTVQTTYTFVVIDAQVMFAVACDNLHLRILRINMRITPVSNQLTVTHMRFLDVLTRFDTYQLRHQTVHHLLVISGFVRFHVRQQT